MKSHAIKSTCGLIAEVISVFLPVLVICLGAKHYHFDIRASPEWSVGSIILFGQACVKFTTSIASVKSAKGPMSLIIVALVTGIVVSCYFLVRATEADLGRNGCPGVIVDNSSFQIVWFSTAVLTYISLGLLCDLAIDRQPS
jgi:uncharacterized membrane protein